MSVVIESRFACAQCGVPSSSREAVVEDGVTYVMNTDIRRYCEPCGRERMNFLLVEHRMRPHGLAVSLGLMLCYNFPRRYSE